MLPWEQYSDQDRARLLGDLSHYSAYQFDRYGSRLPYYERALLRRLEFNAMAVGEALDPVAVKEAPPVMWAAMYPSEQVALLREIGRWADRAAPGMGQALRSSFGALGQFAQVKAYLLERGPERSR